MEGCKAGVGGVWRGALCMTAVGGCEVRLEDLQYAMPLQFMVLMELRLRGQGQIVVLFGDEIRQWLQLKAWF